jgi:8-oxo-dGTP pyrophosphatase MutT (NUDIX family)
MSEPNSYVPNSLEEYHQVPDQVSEQVSEQVSGAAEAASDKNKRGWKTQPSESRQNRWKTQQSESRQNRWKTQQSESREKSKHTSAEAIASATAFLNLLGSRTFQTVTGQFKDAFSYGFSRDKRNPGVDMLKTGKDGITPSCCQSCLRPLSESEQPLNYSFCSKKCSEEAIDHAKGAGVAALTDDGSIVMICDESHAEKGQNGVIEIPGGQGDKELKQIALREFMEETGLRGAPPEENAHDTTAAPCGPTVALRVMWYMRIKRDQHGDAPGKKPNKELVAYFLYLVRIKKFDPNLATEAAVARMRYPSNDPSWRCWCESSRVHAIPLDNLFKIASGEISELRDANGNLVSNVSQRWYNVLTRPSSLEMMQNFYKNPNVTPWVIPVGRTAYVWSPDDLRQK